MIAITTTMRIVYISNNYYERKFLYISQKNLYVSPYLFMFIKLALQKRKLRINFWMTARVIEGHIRPLLCLKIHYLLLIFLSTIWSYRNFVWMIYIKKIWKIWKFTCYFYVWKSSFSCKYFSFKIESDQNYVWMPILKTQFFFIKWSMSDLKKVIKDHF